jgi:hypothetical protein
VFPCSLHAGQAVESGGGGSRAVRLVLSEADWHCVRETYRSWERVEDFLVKQDVAYYQRHTFGRAIGGHQLIAEKIVRMRVAADAGAGLVRHAAELVDSGAPQEAAATAASVAKLHATNAYVSAAREAVQVFGGYGFTEDYPVARH